MKMIRMATTQITTCINQLRRRNSKEIILPSSSQQDCLTLLGKEIVSLYHQ